jgi:hypothetical protein
MYYNAGIVVVISEVVGLAPDFVNSIITDTLLLLRHYCLLALMLLILLHFR